MTTGIKITNLHDIGSNLNYTTVLPVVDLAGVPTTEKANVQILGNAILSGAGGSYFSPAAQALTAQTVSNAAQPNITSVGTLTSLSIQGNLVSSNANLGNLAKANYFQGDGGLLTNVGGVSGSMISNGASNVNISGANSNVTMSVNGTSNVVVISTGGMNVSGTASATYFQGDGSLLTNVSVSAGSYLLNGTSSLFVDTNGNVRTSVAGIANVFTVSSTGVTVSGTMNVSGRITSTVATGTSPFVVSSNTVVANLNASLLSGASASNANTASTIALRDGSGNIRANYFIGNGSQLTGLASGNTIINGTSSVTIATTNGNVAVSVAGTSNILVVSNVGTSLSGNSSVTGNITTGSQLISTIAQGFAPLIVTSNTVVSNLNASFVAGRAPSVSATANSLVARDGNANVTANFFIGDGSQLTGITTTSYTISNGTSSVSVPVANGNVAVTVNGVSNTVVFSDNATTFQGNVVAANAVINGNVAGSQLISTVSDGIPPLVVNSSTTVANLRVETADTANSAYYANYFYQSTSGETLVYPTFTTLYTDGYSQTLINTNISANLDGAIITANGFVGNITSTGTSSFNVIGVNEVDAAVGNIPTLNSSLIQNNNSNIVINVDGNIDLTSNTITSLTVSNTGIYVSGNANISGDLITSNLLASSNISATSNVTAQDNVVTDSIVARTGMLTIASGANSDIVLRASGTGNIDANNSYIINVLNPSGAQDVATKSYVDSIAQGLNVKDAVNYSTASALPTYTYNNGTAGVGATLTGSVNGALSVDGSAVASTNRILVKNEVAGNAPYNGIYVVTNTGNASAAYVLTRSTDFDTWAELISAFTYTTAGATNAGTGWVCTDSAGGTFGTTDISFTQFSGSGSYTAGAGLTLTGTQFSVNVAQPTITSVSSSFTGLTLASNGNITLSGSLSQITGANFISASGNITAPRIISTVAQGTAPFVVSSNTVVANLNASLLSGATTSISNTASTIALRDSTGNISAAYFLGNGSQLSGIPSGTSISNGNSNVTIASSGGNVSVGIAGSANAMVISQSGAALTGNVTANIFISTVPTGTAPLNISSTTKIDNLNADQVDGYDTSTTNIPNTIVVRNAAGNIAVGNISGTLITSAQPSITSVSSSFGNLTFATGAVITLSGPLSTISGANAVTANYFSGNGSLLTSLTGGNVVGAVASATTASTVTGAAQTAITSVGTLTSLTVNGVTNLGTVGNVRIAGGTGGQYLQTDGAGNLSWSAVTGGLTTSNVLAGTGINTIVASGNVTIDATPVIGGADVDYNTLKKLQDKIIALTARVQALENTVYGGTSGALNFSTPSGSGLIATIVG